MAGLLAKLKGGERGNKLKRYLDFWLGIPLAFFAGILRILAGERKHKIEYQKIGVLSFGAIGDLLLATILLESLRKKLPHAHITLLTTKANSGAIPLIGAIDRHVVFEVTDIAGMLRFLRGEKFDLLIDSGQWARLGTVISAFSGAKRTVGFSTKGQYRSFAYDITVTHRNDRHECENFLDLARAVFPDAHAKPALIVPKKDLDLSHIGDPQKCIVFHMWPSGLKAHLKEWPPEYWAELARNCITAGYTILLSGSKADIPATDAFIQKHLATEKGIYSIAGKMNLVEVTVLLHQAVAVVSVNTGIMHLAALVEAPVVALHGPTNPLRWGPVGRKTISLVPSRGHHSYLNLGFEYPPDATPVLKHLSVTTVLQALSQLGIKVKV